MQTTDDHCWQDLIPAQTARLYESYRRERHIGPRPALLLVDLYNLVYRGGDRPIAELADTYPSSCGEVAWRAVAPTKALIAAARRCGLPVIYTTGALEDPASANGVAATNRSGPRPTSSDYEIHDEFPPLPGDLIVSKQRASAFFGTLLSVHLTRLGIQSLVIAGESTSGCVRATVVDAYSLGFEVTVAEECCFDRSEVSHKVNLFDMHHKYANVMKVQWVIDNLRTTEGRNGA